MKLLHAAVSPFARKVTVLLHETGQIDEVELLSLKTSPLDSNPEVRAANPLGKIPALIRPDGPALYDSRVICRFLDARADAGLYPEARLWDVLTLEATADGIMDSAVNISYQQRLLEPEKRSQDWIEGQWSKVSAAVSALNARWMSHLSGPLDMGQIAVGCALGYLDLRHDARAWRKGNDALSEWFAAFGERPSMAATIATG